MRSTAELEEGTREEGRRGPTWILEFRCSSPRQSPWGRECLQGDGPSAARLGPVALKGTPVLQARGPGLRALCSLLGPGREDRRPGPPPRDHHHRCLLHRHRPGERSTRPGGAGPFGGGAFWGAGPAAPECLTRGAHAGYLQQPLGDIPHPLFTLVYLSVLLVGRHPKSLSVSVKVSRISVF